MLPGERPGASTGETIMTVTLMNTQAKNLFPEELETVLEAHPQIGRASVHGVPDGLRGAALVALILWEAAPQSQSQSQPPADAAALAAWCRARLQAYKTPRQWFVCTEWAWTGSGGLS